MSCLLVIIADVDEPPNWKTVRLVLQRHMLITQTLVYTSQDTVSSAKLRVLLFCSCCVPASKLAVDPPVIYEDLVGLFRNNLVDHRIYEQREAAQGLSTLDGVATSDLPPDHIMVMNAMTPSPSSEKSFNDWYAHEHIPLLRLVPSWLSSERFLLTSSAAERVPQCLALHRWNDIGAFETAEYKAATNTPWRTAVMEDIIERERLVLTYEGSLENLALAL
ncbi:hypothetical protein LshimejAT787_0410100 [Lyophyllum shimeji]|uniref:EthD domain-containing protein n=1 Tax=Lyophyllum shimeji TaxID=47721 RepID=A0A9P3UKD0_LYOSH|nr:hypothetical protein LshimejAT787_0410100 [Lyophyllum shimeji]